MATTENSRTAPEAPAPETAAFADRLMGVLNDGMLALLTSVGHRTGLFDTMSTLPPATSTEIAEAAGLQERYVREWLGGMVVGGIVAYEPDGRRYRLPPGHVPALVRASGPDNLAALMEYVGLVGRVEDEVVEAFRRGGGVPYSAYPRFQEIQAQDTARVYDAALVDVLIPFAQGVTERLHEGIDALDVGTGHGHAPIVLARAFPRSRFTGLDQSAQGLAAGTAEAAQLGLGNVTFVESDSTRIPGTYDLITAFDVIHDLARPAETLDAIAAALRPGGVFLMGDMAASSNLEDNIGHPLGPTLYGISLFYCMTTSLSTGGAGLGTVWGEQTARRMLADAGFTGVETHSIEGDPFNLYYVATKGRD
ncbi:class I SAM-dependent methyltransferase [Streptomyces sp. MUM 203J]|uniref:class I SAM-dependent methyltransferase n=1 Tax=Streptomyces sp. MUM 203J TaxID=2791990 RepID=UPI001F03E706|nr:class I SAM-dependent methyltransferase [Streptomyces sp. MUM 203J]MCH0542913.1 class I SAM-dependent methyltransferase [Streptomyces sp. MUM 203J]